MATAVLSHQMENLAELVHELGDIPLERIRLKPPPGTAGEDDLLSLLESVDKRLCELVDGVLVEKPMGALESFLAGYLLRQIGNFMEDNDLGIPFGADGPFRILPGKVRLPDVSVFKWQSLPNRKVPAKKVPELVPDLTIEVVTAGNTPREIQRKLEEYFAAGVKEVWVVYPANRTARTYSAPKKFKKVTLQQSLACEAVLPGFELPMAKLFEKVEEIEE